jgi:hypothetical protein
MRRMGRIGPIARWLGFSTVCFVVWLVVLRFEMLWLCAGLALLTGFLTDCLVDILAARSHQRKLRGEYTEKFPSGNEERRKRFEASEEEEHHTKVTEVAK